MRLRLLCLFCHPKNVQQRYVTEFSCLAQSRAAARSLTEYAEAWSAMERAICASPDLLAQDRLLAETYAEALARDPSRGDAIRQAQRQWLNERTAACAATPAKDLQGLPGAVLQEPPFGTPRNSDRCRCTGGSSGGRGDNRTRPVRDRR